MEQLEKTLEDFGLKDTFSPVSYKEEYDETGGWSDHLEETLEALAEKIEEQEREKRERQQMEEWVQDAEEIVDRGDRDDGLERFQDLKPLLQQDIDAEKQNIRLEYFTEAENYQNRYNDRSPYYFLIQPNTSKSIMKAR